MFSTSIDVWHGFSRPGAGKVSVRRPKGGGQTPTTLAGVHLLPPVGRQSVYTCTRPVGPGQSVLEVHLKVGPRAILDSRDIQSLLDGLF